MEVRAQSDPFAWLEDQHSPETRRFLDHEGHRYDAYLAQHASLRSRVGSRVAELLKVETVELPFPDHRGGLIFLKRTAHEEQRSIKHRDEDGSETCLISLGALGLDHRFSLSIVKISSDGRYLAFGVRAGGEDVLEIGFYDLNARCILADRLSAGFHRGVIFDQDVVYYSSEPAVGKDRDQRTIRCHRFGTRHEDDLEVFSAGADPALRLLLCESEDGSALGYLLIAQKPTIETRFIIQPLPLRTAPEEVVSLAGGIFAPRFWNSHIEALTNWEAPLGRIVRIFPAQPSPTDWQTLIEIPGERIESFQLLGCQRVIHSVGGNGKKTHIFQPDGRRLRSFDYPRTGTTVIASLDETNGVSFSAHSDVEERTAISSLNLTTGERRVWWAGAKQLTGLDSACERRECPSSGGVRVPVDVVRPKAPHRMKPVVLTAYGSGASDLTPRFSVLQTVLLEAGFVCAVARVRGGGSDPSWREAGRGSLKQNSVADLIAAAEWLIADGYCTADHLGIVGQSSGALLVLCALTQRPDLFRAALALGPIADLTRFHKFGVGRWFVEELGSPDDETNRTALCALSPYHRVRNSMIYPATLLISGDRDKRCDALHARKMTARLREAETPGRPILLDYTGLRGHKAALPLSERVRSLTNRLTFLIAELTDIAGGGR